MTTTPCPISWLRLEQYALEELVGTAVHDVEHHLATCEACRDDLATIRADHRPMRALERSQASKGSNVVRGPWWWWSVPLAAAAAALLVLRIERPPEAHKGGELAISVVVERSGHVLPHPTHYEAGDRVQIQLTCPLSRGPAAWVWVGFEGEAPGQVLGRGTTPCGNALLLPVAVELSGTQPLELCVALSPPDPPADLGSEVACASLAPATPGAPR